MARSDRYLCSIRSTDFTAGGIEQELRMIRRGITFRIEKRLVQSSLLSSFHEETGGDGMEEKLGDVINGTGSSSDPDCPCVDNIHFFFFSAYLFIALLCLTIPDIVACNLSDYRN